MPHGASERLNPLSHSLRMIAIHHQPRKNGPQKPSRKSQTLFNIHIPNQDHRDRG